MKSHTLLYHIYYCVALRRLVELNDEIREAITGRSQISKSTFTVRFLVIRRYQGREWTVCMMYTVFISYACTVYNFLVCFRPVSSLNVLGGHHHSWGGHKQTQIFFRSLRSRTSTSTPTPHPHEFFFSFSLNLTGVQHNLRGSRPPLVTGLVCFATLTCFIDQPTKRSSGGGASYRPPPTVATQLLHSIIHYNLHRSSSSIQLLQLVAMVRTIIHSNTNHALQFHPKSSHHNYISNIFSNPIHTIPHKTN